MPKAKKFYLCSICNMDFKNKKDHFEKHIQSGKHPKKCNLPMLLPKFECLLCPVMFSTQDSLTKHMKVCHY